MALLLAELASALGAPAGALIAYLVPDETSWYPSYFLLAGAVFAAVAGALSGWLGLAIAGVLILSLTRAWVPLLAASAGVVAVLGSVTGVELLLLSLLFCGGYLYSRGARRSLWWLALMPTVIILASLLSL